MIINDEFNKYLHEIADAEKVNVLGWDYPSIGAEFADMVEYIGDINKEYFFWKVKASRDDVRIIGLETFYPIIWNDPGY